MKVAICVDVDIRLNSRTTSLKILTVVFLVLGSLLASAQQYSFPYSGNGDAVTINNDGEDVYCLFRLGKASVETIYRKVILTSNLRPVDSIDYRIEGSADLIASGGSEKYTYHVFETKVEKVPAFVFLITDKAGNIQFTFRKFSPDFIQYFGKEIKIKQMKIQFLPDQSPDQLLIEVFVPDTNLPVRIVALKMQDGSPLWFSNTPTLDFVQTTESLLIGLSKQREGSQSTYVIHFLDKQTGEQRHSTPFNVGPKRRSVAVVSSNGRQLLIAGDEYKEQNLKDSRFFMTMFDLEGKQLFDKIDTTDRMGKYRRHLMGSIFDQEGNLVLIGEGYKRDATKAVVSTAAGIAIGVLLGGPAIISSDVENRIDFITSAVLSSDNGQVKQYRTFPVGPWYDFANFMTDGEHILIGVSNKFLLYNASEPDVPPVMFATLRSRERLLLTSFGPAISYRNSSRKRIVVELLHPEEGKR
ncbi:hypothetical protein BH10BAC4_BH10BAC4_00310 [soil metagenome]